jgi:LCP family protein required for cell wall assembly
LLLLLSVFLLLLLGTGTLIWFDPPVLGALSMPFFPVQAGAVPWDGAQPINILAMGIDQRVPGEKTLSDTMIVLSIDPATQQVRMVSIPRDLAVTVPGYGTLSKINEGYYLGGPTYAEYTVESALGIPINYYAVLHFQAFEHLIDAVGGIDIKVDQAISDPTYPADVGSGYDPFYLSAGMHHMDGALALKFVRERHAYTSEGGDELRVQHQQEVLMAIKGKLLSFNSVLHMPTILEALRQTVVTNLPENMLSVVALRILQDRNLQHVYFNEQNNMVYQCEGNDLGADLCPTPAFWSSIHALFTDPRLAAEHASLWVENGTSIDGEAAAVAGTLATCHFTVAGYGDADNSQHAHSEIIVNTAQPAAPYTTTLLRQMFGAHLSSARLPAIHAQIVVLLGADVAQIQ